MTPEITPRTALERHAQTLILSVVTGLILWVGVSVTGTRESMVRLEVRVESVSAALEELKSARNGSYTRAEADRTHAEMDRRLSMLEGRVTKLEAGR